MRSIVRVSKSGLMWALLLVGCGGSGGAGGQDVTATRLVNTDFPGASNFVAEVTNPYLPLAVGSVWRYRSATDDGVEETRVEVTDDSKTILGVPVTVVHDQVFVDGKLQEDTFDWYAQDKAGNVWYFGEDTRELDKNGNTISTEGSWEAGKTGAAGIVMLAHPKIGLAYHQEDAEAAQDRARVLSLEKTVTVPAGTFTNCVQTMEWTPIEPGVREFKYYARGVGLVLELQPSHGRIRNELISFEPG